MCFNYINAGFTECPKPKIKASQWQKVKKRWWNGRFWEEVCPQKIHHLLILHSWAKKLPQLWGKRPSYPTHSSPFFWGCVADPTLRPSMSGVAARVRDIAQSREIQLSLLQQNSTVFLGGEGWFIFFLTCNYGTSILFNIYNICISMWHLWNDIICVSWKRCRHVQM